MSQRQSYHSYSNATCCQPPQTDATKHNMLSDSRGFFCWVFFLSWLAGSNFGSRDPFDSSSLSMQQANAAIPKIAKTTTAIVVGAVSGPSSDKMFFQPKTNKQQITRNRQHRKNKRHTEYLSTFFEYITRNILNAHNTHLDKTVYIGICSLVPCHRHVIPFFPKNKKTTTEHLRPRSTSQEICKYTKMINLGFPPGGARTTFFWQTQRFFSKSWGDGFHHAPTRGTCWYWY